MSILERTISVSDLRENGPEVFRECREKGQRYTVTLNSGVTGVIISPVEWEMIVETLAILDDQNLLDQLKVSESDIKDGNVRLASDVFDEIDEATDDQLKARKKSR